VILGPTGRNFGAGMSGGVAFVLDDGGRFADRVNTEMVDIDPLDDDDRDWLLDRVGKHRHETGSLVASRMLDHWDASVERFVKVMPKDLKRVTMAASQARSAGVDELAAVMASSQG
jgi:glutamate synthase (NADPH/NADH) large chain